MPVRAGDQYVPIIEVEQGGEASGGRLGFAR